MDKIVDWVKENKVVVAAAGGVLAVSGLLYVLLKDDNSSSQSVQQQGGSLSVENLSQNLKSSEKYQTILQEAVSKIQIIKDQQNPECIEFQTIAKILETSVELSSEHYIALTKQQRIKRRTLQGSDYEQEVINQCDEIENMLNSIQEDIISKLGIDQQAFEQSLMLLIQKGLHQQLIYLDMAVKQQLKMKLESQEKENLPRAKEIIQYQNEVIKQEPDFFKGVLQNLVQNPEMQQKLPQIINIMLCDKVYNKYGIEEEDIVKMLGTHAQNDSEILKLMQDAEEGMRSLLQSVLPMQGQGGFM